MAYETLDRSLRWCHLSQVEQVGDGCHTQWFHCLLLGAFLECRASSRGAQNDEERRLHVAAVSRIPCVWWDRKEEHEVSQWVNEQISKEKGTDCMV